jgi:hypothetical protein
VKNEKIINSSGANPEEKIMLKRLAHEFNGDEIMDFDDIFGLFEDIDEDIVFEVLDIGEEIGLWLVDEPEQCIFKDPASSMNINSW